MVCHGIDRGSLHAVRACIMDRPQPDEFPGLFTCDSNSLCLVLPADQVSAHGLMGLVWPEVPLYPDIVRFILHCALEIGIPMKPTPFLCFPSLCLKHVGL